MLDGKELEGKIGEVGSYSLDVTDKGHVDAALSLAISKDLIPGVSVNANVSGGFQVKVATLVAAQAAKSDNKLLKLLAGALAKLDAGEEVHADVQAALEQHVTPVA
jgi:hypothetical protein